ncbi:hypothetical protein MKEN_00559700 [Mycena kentingensis (nom. inval.)]|nr:hypothetical protein MKEN_00559700 [Mycena kentingensis (nom. inval.)]
MVCRDEHTAVILPTSPPRSIRPAFFPSHHHPRDTQDLGSMAHPYSGAASYIYANEHRYTPVKTYDDYNSDVTLFSGSSASEGFSPASTIWSSPESASFTQTVTTEDELIPAHFRVASHLPRGLLSPPRTRPLPPSPPPPKSTIAHPQPKHARLPLAVPTALAYALHPYGHTKDDAQSAVLPAGEREPPPPLLPVSRKDVWFDDESVTSRGTPGVLALAPRVIDAKTPLVPTRLRPSPDRDRRVSLPATYPESRAYLFESVAKAGQAQGAQGAAEIPATVKWLRDWIHYQLT